MFSSFTSSVTGLYNSVVQETKKSINLVFEE